MAKVLVLKGGTSNEREISLLSASSVAKSLKENGCEVVEYDTEKGFEGLLDVSADLVFPILHGSEGEDGSIQKFLEEHNLKYLGSDSVASTTCFDKAGFKKLLKKSGILTPEWEVVRADFLDNSDLIDNPYVLKPISGGSSIDTCIVRTGYDSRLIPSKELFSRYPSMLLEKLIIGTEITVTVLDDSALPVIEIIPPKNEEFDYKNKYNGRTKEVCPPQNINTSVQLKAQELAENVHNISGARHLSRVDIMVTPDEDLYVLELNTMPGLTDQSLVPKAAHAMGISMVDLVQKFCEMVKRDYSLH